MSKPIYLNNRLFNTTIIAFSLIIIAYIFAETRHPALNYDDTYWLGSHFPMIANGHFWPDGLYFMMFKHNLVANEFRTYGLSKLFQFGLFKLFGTNILAYYCVMAAMSVGAAVCASIAAKTTTGSTSVAIALASCCLLGPFMLFETFHHASYLLLPLFLTTAYLALNGKEPLGRKGRLTAALLCVLTVMTGEIAAVVLLAILGMLIVRAWQCNNKPRMATLLIDFLIAFTTLALLYAYYRVVIFDASLSTRFFSSNILTPHSVWRALVGFNASIVSLVFSCDAMEIFSSGWAVVDQSVVAIIFSSALVAVVAIFRSSAEPARASFRPALFMFVVYLASCSAYVLVAAKAGIENYPARYLQVSGLFFIAALCFVAAALPALPRKIVLCVLVLLVAAGGALTFGVKVTSLEAIHAQLTKDVLAGKARGGQNVVFLVPASDGGLMDPNKFAPADTPLREWWILTYYCQITWGLSCAPGTSQKPDDIVIKSDNKHDGWPAATSVTGPSVMH